MITKIEKKLQINVPIIYILIGLPGSGKSTWTQDLTNKSERDFTIISSDAEIEKMAREVNKTYSEVYDRYIGKAIFIMKENAKNAIADVKNIIWDQTNVTKKKRKRILEALSNEYYKVAVDFTVDPKELERRLEKRAKETGKFIPKFVIDSLGKSYQAPSKDEGFDEIIKIKT